MSEQKVAVGVCREVTERGDWVIFAIDVGSQYPVKLNTKKDEIVEAGRAAAKSGETRAWHYNESESDRINERSGKPYINRYLEQVASPDGETTSSFGSKSSSETKHRNSEREVDWDAKDRRDFRSRAWAQTISLFAHTFGPEARQPQNIDAVFTLLQGFQRKVYEDITGTFAYPADGSDLPEVLQPDALDPNDPDNDIPF